MIRFDDIYVPYNTAVDSVLNPYKAALSNNDPINLQFTSGMHIRDDEKR